MPFNIKRSMAFASTEGPLAIISFSGDQNTLNWLTQSATAVTITDVGSVALSGSIANPTDRPASPYNSFTRSYTLSASANNVTVTAQISVTFPHTYPGFCRFNPTLSGCGGYSG